MSEGNINCKLKYSVSDTGRGITKEKRSTLFKFLDPQNYLNQDLNSEGYQNTTSLAGTGLGISQKIAHQLNTNIEFTSTQGAGSTFWFTIDITDPFEPMNPESQNNIEFAREAVRKTRKELKSSRKPPVQLKKLWSKC